MGVGDKRATKTAAASKTLRGAVDPQALAQEDNKRQLRESQLRFAGGDEKALERRAEAAKRDAFSGRQLTEEEIAQREGFQAAAPAAPPPPPDATDKALRERATDELLRQRVRRGLASTYGKGRLGG